MFRAGSVVPAVLSTIVFFGTGAAVSEVAGGEVHARGTGEDSKSVLSFPWSVQEIAGDIGNFTHVAVAVDSYTGDVFIAYYVSGPGDLWLARTVSQNGNCGPGNTWKCDEIHTAGDVGKYCSIAVRPNPGGQAEFIIPYYDATNERLMYFKGQAYDYYVTGLVTRLDSGFTDTDRTGMYTAVQYDSNGNPWIAYQNETYGDSVGTHRMIAQWVGDGSGNCGESVDFDDWNCFDLYNNGFSQSFSSTAMTLDDQSRPVVAYYDDHLKYPVLARYLGAGGNCGPGSAWRCFSIAPRPGDTDTGRHVVPFVVGNSLSAFYQNSSTGMLEKASYVYPASGNCGWSGVTLAWEWQCDTISFMDGTLTNRGVSVAADASGYPIVAYQFSDEPGPAVLGVARPVESPEVDDAGNCGPSDSWHCQIVDGGSYRTEAESVSLVVDTTGAGFIAYHEWDDYNYEHNLKLATMPGAAVFSDGFESGNTSAWSNTAP